MDICQAFLDCEIDFNSHFGNFVLYLIKVVFSRSVVLSIL